jgi:hypothetical protein
MSDKLKPSNPRQLPVDADGEQREATSESFTEAIKPLIPVVTAYLDHQSQLAEQQLVLSKLQSEGNLSFAKERLKVGASRERRQFWLTVALIVPLTIVTLGSAAGLIFFKDNVQAGIFLLTHFVAIAIGAVGGAGWQKSKQESSARQ